MGLLKFLFIFPCHIMFLLLCVISNLTLLTKSFFYLKFHILYCFLVIHYLFHLWICDLQVILSGDIELNPVPKPNSGQNISLCHWNLDNIPAYNFFEIFSAYNSLYEVDIICLSEIYLDSSILSQFLNPSDVVRVGVCVCYKNHLPLKLLNINYLQECIIFELSIKEN